MEYETGHHYSQNPSLGYGHHYYYNNRNMPLTASQDNRSSSRVYPIGGPVGGSGPQASMRRENMEGGQSRRRIAVACARCRKRKIRCSGDPGDGTGCASCKMAGVDAQVCQFHRVGSNEATRIIDSMNFSQNLQSFGNNSTAIMHMYEGAGEAMYTRSSYPLDPKPVYPQGWAVSYPENTSTMDGYTLEPSNTYLTGQQAVSTASSYPANYRWQHSSKQAPGGTYLERNLTSTHNTQGLSLPYPTATNLRNTAPSELLSSLNMTSLQLSLPERSQTGRQLVEPAAPDRTLPAPQPSPAQNTRNIVDQLQNQRLHSVVVPKTSSSINGFAKPSLTYHAHSDIQVTPTTESSAAQSVISCPTDSTISYLSSGSADDIPSSSAETQPSLNFSTSHLLDPIPTPVVHTTYSNFRNYNPPTSSSGESIPIIARQNSPTNTYAFGVPDRRHISGDTPNDATMVSGHRYTPYDATQPHHRSSTEGLRRESPTKRVVSGERAAVGTQKRSYC